MTTLSAVHDESWALKGLSSVSQYFGHFEPGFEMNYYISFHE
jgi:hypothetical protein